MTKATHHLGVKVVCIFLTILTGMSSFFGIVGILFAGESGIFSDMPKSYYETPWCQNTTYSYCDTVAQFYLDGTPTKEIAELFSNDNTNFAFELYDSTGMLIAASNVPENTGTATSYTFYYSEQRMPDGTFQFYDPPAALEIIGYVADPLTAADNYWLSYRLYSLTMSLGYWLIVIALVSLLVFAASLIYLLCAAGHRGDTDEITLNVQDRIPLDLYLLLAFLGCSFCLGIAQQSSYYSTADLPFILTTIFTLLSLEAILLATLMTLSTRLKKGNWWKNSISYPVLRFFWNVCKAVISTIGDFIHALPSTWKVAVGWLVLSTIYLSSSSSASVVLVLNFVLLVVFCAVASQWQKLSRAGKQLSAGNLDYKVNTTRMFRTFRQHGENLNNISQGISIALNQKMKSERLRTELITNVSHDIKTPLTSIINYVDLLKKEDLTGQAAEYIEVLDRQSRRLKKLTEDLVEASKASTGNIHCSLAPTDLIELVQQAVGEYEEKLAAAHLEAIISGGETEAIYGLVDGNLMWRVLSNLLSNACKYSQPHTRVYLQVKSSGDFVLITVKNISRDPLNIAPDELMERFVRGDSSRSTEGSGLGLNIARSLVELQKGKFTIAIDGDLFKAQIRCPRAAVQQKPTPPTISAEQSNSTPAPSEASPSV